jgi:hypothetical protein
MRRVIKTLAVLTLAVLTLALLGPAAAASAAATGGQAFTIFSTGADRTVVATGVVNGVGSQFVDSRQDNPDGTFTTRERLVFPGGTLMTATAGSRSASFDPQLCLRTVTSSGTVDVVDGTGPFVGAAATGTFSARALLAGQRGPTGCSSERLVFLVVRVSATLTLR